MGWDGMHEHGLRAHEVGMGWPDGRDGMAPHGLRWVLRKPGSGIGTGFSRPEQPEQPSRFSIFEIGMAAQVCIDLSLPVCLSAALGGRIYSYIHQASRPLIFRLFRRGGDDDLFRRNLNIFFAKPLTRPRWPTV